MCDLREQCPGPVHTSRINKHPNPEMLVCPEMSRNYQAIRAGAITARLAVLPAPVLKTSQPRGDTRENAHRPNTRSGLHGQDLTGLLQQVLHLPLADLFQG